MTPAQAVFRAPAPRSSPMPTFAQGVTRTRMQRLPGVLLDMVLALGLIASIPAVILVVGAPLALAIKLVLWLTERL